MRGCKLNARQFWNIRWINNGTQDCLYDVSVMLDETSIFVAIYRRFFPRFFVPFLSNVEFSFFFVFFFFGNRRGIDAIRAIDRDFIRNYPRKSTVRLKFRRQTVRQRNTFRLCICFATQRGCKRTTLFFFFTQTNGKYFSEKHSL